MFRNETAWYLKVSSYWFSNSFKWFSVLILLPSFVAQGTSPTEKNTYWGLIVMVGGIEALIGPALWGRFSDRVGRRNPFLVVGALLTVAALLGLAESKSLLGIGCFYLLLQISDDIATGPYAAVLPDAVPVEHQGRAAGVMGTLQAAAQVCAALAVIALSKQPHMILILASVLQVISSLLVVRTLSPEVRRSHDASKRPSFIALLRDRSFLWVCATRFMVSLGFTVLTTFGVYFMTDRVRIFDVGALHLGDPLKAAGLIALIIALVGTASAYFGGVFSDRMDQRRIISICGWIMFVSILPFAVSGNYPTLLALSVLFGVGYGAYSTADWALASRVLPEKSASAGLMGIWQGSIALPQLLIGPIGFSIDMGNRYRAGAGYSTVFAFAALLFLLGSLLVRQVRITKKEMPSPKGEGISA